MFTFTEGERGFGQNGPFLLGFLLTMNLRIPPHLCPLPRSGGEEMPKSHRRNGMRSPLPLGERPGEGCFQLSNCIVTAQVPSCHEARYRACSLVSVSISTPIDFNFNAAMLASMLAGTG